MPKDSGSGTTNDGNTARKAFRNYKVFSEITGVSEYLIKRLWILLCLINSNHNVDPKKFNDYSLEIFYSYIKNYNWFYMPVSIHKLLIHGAEVISNFLLPIGSYSEEAQESRNKDSKRGRLQHSRKINRIVNNVDHFHYLMRN